MSVIDTSQWKAFHLYDIFQIDMGNKFDRGKMPVGDEVNFVGRTGVNNGINAVCGFVENVEPYPPGLITLALGGTIGACFVQPRKFYTSQNVIVLKPKQKLSFAMKEFVSTIIWRVSNIYYSAFSNELNRHIKTDFVFWLPVTTSGSPDWDYMDSFMGEILEKEESSAKQLAALAPETSSDGHFLDVSGWKAFRIGDLFSVCTTKSLDKLMLDLSDEYEYAYVGRTEQNNGILGYLKKQDFEPNEADTFSVVQIGAKVCCYQPQGWYATQNIFKLKLHNTVPKSVSLFLASIITNTLKFVFGNNAYTSYPTKSSLENLLISLPITSDGQPDWDWMEQYMQQQFDKVEPLSKHLVELI